MKIGVVGTFEGAQPFGEYLRGCRDLGLEAIELIRHPSGYGNTVSYDAAGFREMKRMLREAGIEIAAIGGGTDFVQPTPEDLAKQVDEAKRQVDLARALDCTLVRIFAGNGKPDISEERSLDSMVEGMKRAAEYAAANGVYLAHENHGNLTNRGEFVREIQRRVDSPHLAVAIDASNFRWFGNDLATIHRLYQEFAPFTRYVHAKDGSASKGFLRDYTALALGEGEIELKHLLECLKAAGYQGPVCVEYEGSGSQRIGIAKGVGYLRAARQFLGMA